MRLSEAEYASISGRAREVGLTVPGYLAERGGEPLVDQPARHGGLSQTQMRGLVAELYALRRILTGADINLAQLRAHADIDTATEFDEHRTRLAPLLANLVSLTDDLRGWVDT